MKYFSYYFKKLKGNPVALAKRAWRKLVVEPRQYKTKTGYDAQRFWGDRFSKFGEHILGPGDETFSAEANDKMYREGRETLIRVLKEEIGDLRTARVLEIGIGNGFYTQMLWDLGVKEYTGMDITDALFERHQKRFPEYTFVRQDVCSKPIAGKFDVIMIIDVIEHMVERDKFEAAMRYIREALNPGGILLLTPIADKTRRHLYYVRLWSKEDILRFFEDCEVKKMVPFRVSQLLVAQAPK